jgi:ADP-heptose:LPS heptosyltransferase/Flp pilus assembly protein TadD
MLGLTFLRRRALRRMWREADAARDSKQYMKAATLYASVLRRVPDNGRLHVQCGHMFKEAGALDRAEQQYDEARMLMPDDPDLALQLGHFYKVAGRFEEAELSYRKAIELMPDDPDLALQLGHFYKVAGRFEEAELSYRKAIELMPDDPDMTLQLGHFYRMVGRFDDAELFYRKATELMPDCPEPADELASLLGNRKHSLWMIKPLQLPFLSELAPSAPASRLHPHAERIEFRQLGRRQRTAWGTHTTLRGVEAIRGFCVSASPVTDLCMRLNGVAFHKEGPLDGYPLKYESQDRHKQKYVFHVWYDFGAFVSGRYSIEIQWTCANGRVQTYRDLIVINEPLSADEYPTSDQLVTVSPNDNRPLDVQINTQPSMIRKARRALLSPPPRNVLIIRPDQLGDMVTSIPAIQRLRELLPDARFVGLLSPANYELAESLHIFDEIIAIGFAEDEWEQRRVLSPDKQQELRQQLIQFEFDLAIDLSISTDSRPLLALSGSPYTLGYKDDRSPWLSASIGIEARNAISGFCELSHSGQVAALVEYLGILLNDRSQIIRRSDLTRDRLTRYGLGSDDSFAVLHTGARLKFSQWPHYDMLASMLIDKTGLKVVMMTDDPTKRTNLPRQLAASDRFQLLDKRLPFDDFDALLSFCSVFVGNDSGPSHLASLRGTPVVNLFMARHDWNEWGHENKGYIISRRVPCAGCNIHYDPEECSKGFPCIINISTEEVFETIIKLI